VLALVGDSSNGIQSGFLTPHRPGTLLTPFIYLTGFTRGLSPATLAWDIPGTDSALDNLDGQFRGPMRLRTALANDYLIPAGQVFDQMGAFLIQQTTLPFGLGISATTAQGLLETENRYTILDMSRAYSVFAAQGTSVGFPSPNGLVPSALLSIRSVDGIDYADWGVPQSEQVVSAPLAYLINNVLSDETARWPSLGRPNPFELGRPVAAKPGATFDGLDTWAAGYTPQRVVVVWMGASQPLTFRPAAGLWSAVMQAASRETSSEGWLTPPGIVHLRVCDPSGLLPTAACPNVVDEVFIDGYQPVQADTLYRTYAVNRETGFLATVYTPQQLVEERVYLLVPPEARDWAVSTGLETPPTTYDTLRASLPSPNVSITSPGMFADLKGKVIITGTAAGDDFAYYRLQAGQGLNPEAWVLIAEGQDPVSAGTLAEWDTSGLNGLYALQLLLVRADDSLETATIQVMVDNDPPQIVLDFPKDGAEISLAENPKITFQPRVVDNLFLTSVEIYVDEKRLRSFKTEPFAASWNASKGEHTVRIMARDRMGNASTLEVKFTVK
jgi:membrane carboxypeptidase/penicillin-binding protein PbpC